MAAALWRNGGAAAASWLSQLASSAANGEEMAIQHRKLMWRHQRNVLAVSMAA